MSLVYLSLGSNIDRYRHITAALDALSSKFGESQISSVYESESVGFEGSHFLNLVVGIQCESSLLELSQWLKKIEDENGRDRSAKKFSPRTLDIDILTFGELSGEHDGIELPRAEITKNAFVLLPLAEIAEDEIHPATGKSYSKLWAEYKVESQKLWKVKFEWNGEIL